MDSLQQKRESMYLKAYILLILIILAGAGFYSFKKWQDYDFLKNGFATNQAAAEALSTLAVEEQNAYDEKKPEFTAFSDTVSKSLVAIFPSEEQYTELTKKMDEIEGELSTASNPIEISNITYQKPIKLEGYSVLPFRITVRSSNPNFTKFLKMIEGSGSVDSALRLMDIPSIKLSFEDMETDTGEANKVIEFTLQVNAYFQ